MDLIIDWHEGLFREFQLVLGLGFGGVVLLAPEGKLFIHGIDIIVDKLDALAQRGSVLADTLNHALDKLQLFVSQVTTGTNDLFRSFLLLFAAQFAQTDLILSFLFLFCLFLNHHFVLSLCLDALDVL